MRAQRVAVFSVFAAAVLFLSGCRTENCIKIGLNAELTGSVPVVGKSCKNAAIMAIDEINAHGGIALADKTVPVKLLIEDNEDKAESAAAIARKFLSKLMRQVFDLFPVLGERKRQSAATLSGGEQQMLALGRAIVADGDLLVLDEPSMGLSPKYVRTVFSAIAELNKIGKTVLLVEQNATMALQYAHRAYVLENGRIRAQGAAKDIAANEELKRAYLG